MRSINLIVVHCSATRADHALTTENLESEHRRRGFHGIGYHYYIRRDGTVVPTRPLGGLDCNGHPADTRTPEQKSALRLLVHQLLKRFRNSYVCGYRDLSPDLNGNGVIEPEEWVKVCPCFEVGKEL